MTSCPHSGGQIGARMPAPDDTTAALDHPAAPADDAGEQPLPAPRSARAHVSATQPTGLDIAETPPSADYAG
jgi:hypothetical protein